MDDFQKRFKDSLDRNLHDVSAKPLPATARRRVRLRRTLLASGSTLLLAVLVGGFGLVLRSTQHSDPLPPAEASPSPSSTPSEERRSSQLEWPSPFVPDVQSSGDRRTLTAVFPDRTVAQLSYPAELRLAEMGVQPTISYTFREARPDAPHDVIFIRGESPPGLLDPDPLETFADPSAAVLHEVIYEDLRGDPPFALVYEKSGWTIVATLQQSEDAEKLAQNLHPSVTKDGWPAVLTTGPVALSEGFGEARGAHLEIGDSNPLFDRVDGGDDFRYITMGPVPGCDDADEGVSGSGRDWYASRCLGFEGGELGIFMSIYGPEDFVRTLYQGIELDDRS